MDYIVMTIQLLSMGLTWIYIDYFLMALLVREDTTSESNNKKYDLKLLLISVGAFIISILNVLNCDFVSFNEMITVLRWWIIFLIVNVFIDRDASKDVVHRKPQLYEKKIKVGMVILFILLVLFLACTYIRFS